MPNRLIDETSPYLLQHASNPVDWFPWGDEALNKARKENKPIFLSIGYAACHWCHVMESESFTDPETAAMMNANFVNIKVDREERPDLDSIYMTAVTAMTGSGGWPMSVFLTPEGRPFYGGTYFPPTRRYGMPSFKEVLYSAARSWQEAKGDIYRVADRLTMHLQQTVDWGAGSGDPLEISTLEKAAEDLINSYDWEHGGWGGAPKFPQPMAIEFLFQQAARGNTHAIKPALDALRAMQRGGIYDLVGGGFHRYSTDDRWLVPHFEKMLYDNAQLALVYLHGYQITGDEAFRRTCEETLDFLLREMSDAQGGFFSSLDADSENEEGLFYLWGKAELEHFLPQDLEWEIFRDAYGVTDAGNFEGRMVLQQQIDDERLAQKWNLTAIETREKLRALRQRLFDVRQNRVRPATDDKVLVSWNALALIAFAEAARVLDRADYLLRARMNADFLLTSMRQNGRLMRAWRAGQARHNGFLEDYAGLALALLALYQTDHDPRWYAAARDLAGEMAAAFKDPAGGFFNTREDHGALVIRPKEIQDNAVPSGNALAAMALLQLDAYEENGSWRDMAEQALRKIQGYAIQYPMAFSAWLQAMDFALGPVHQVALVAEKDLAALNALLPTLQQSYRPRMISAAAALPLADTAPALLRERPAKDGKATAYVCHNFACELPVTGEEALLEQLPAPLRSDVV